MIPRSLIRGGLVMLGVMLCAPSRAHALVLITHGDTIKHIGDVALKPEQGNPLPANKVGFKYSYGGVFWLDLWTWGGEYCLYEGTRFDPITPARAAQYLNVPESDLSKPFLYTFPLGLLILVPLCGIGILASVFGKKKPDPIARLFEDPKYQKALAILSEQYAKQEAADTAVTTQPRAEQEGAPNPDRVDAAFEAGVQYLTDQGVPREEAAQKLRLMVHVLLVAKNTAEPSSERMKDEG